MKYTIAMTACCSIWVVGQAQGRVDVQGTQPAEQLEYVQAAHSELMRARDLIIEGKYDAASRVLKPAIERYGMGTMGPKLRRELGEVAIRHGRLQEAFALMPPRREGQWGTDRDYATIGFLEAAVGDYALSKAMWDESGPVRQVKEDQMFRDDWPDVYTVDGLKSAWLLVIAKLSSMEDCLGQEFYLALVQKMQPDNAILNFDLACVAGGKKDYSRAEQLFEKAWAAAHNYEFQQFCQRQQSKMRYQRILQEKSSRGGGK